MIFIWNTSILLQDQDTLIHELHSSRFFDVFEFNAAKKYWACFMCNHPEKMWDLMKNGTPVIAVRGDKVLSKSFM
jgi:hypothetical protein